MRKQAVSLCLSLVLGPAFAVTSAATPAWAQSEEPAGEMTANARTLLAGTNESCSLDALRYLKIIDGVKNKVPLEQAVKDAGTDADPAGIRKIYNLADVKGLAETRLVALGNYAFCMKDVKQEAVQSVFSRQPPYLACGEEAAIDYRILDDLKKGKTVDDLSAVLPAAYHDQIRAFADLVKNKSLEVAADSATASVVFCIEEQSGKTK